MTGLAYLLDTNIVIHARDGNADVMERFEQHDGSVMLSALCLAELQRGLYAVPAQAALRQLRLDSLLGGLPILAFDAAAAMAYGVIIAQCGWVRRRDFDRMIAAHAISLGMTLVTDNEADYRDIPGLAIENWVRSPN